MTVQLDMERTLLQAPVEKELCELDITRTGWWSKWPCLQLASCA